MDQEYKWPIEPPEPLPEHSEEHKRHIEKFIDMPYREWQTHILYGRWRDFNERLRVHRETLKNQGTNPGSPLPPQSKKSPKEE